MSLSDPLVYAKYNWLAHCRHHGKRVDPAKVDDPIFIYPWKEEDDTPLPVWVSASVHPWMYEQQHEAVENVKTDLLLAGAVVVEERFEAMLLVVNKETSAHTKLKKMQKKMGWLKLVDRDWVEDCVKNKSMSWTDRSTTMLQQKLTYTKELKERKRALDAEQEAKRKAEEQAAKQKKPSSAHEEEDELASDDGEEPEEPRQQGAEQEFEDVPTDMPDDLTRDSHEADPASEDGEAASEDVKPTLTPPPQPRTDTQNPKRSQPDMQIHKQSEPDIRIIKQSQPDRRASTPVSDDDDGASVDSMISVQRVPPPGARRPPQRTAVG